jgi:hypothetical protein
MTSLTFAPSEGISQRIKPMSNTNDPVSIMNKFLLNYMRHVHTIKPALVTKVEGNRVSATILTQTKFKDGHIQPFPAISNVPLMVYSGGMGTSRITVPVASGDMVLILFSDRDYGNMLQTGTLSAPDDLKTHEFHPIGALPCIFALPDEKPIEPGKVVIESGPSRISVGLNGVVEIAATTINITGTVNHTGSYVLNGLPIETHRHTSASPGSPTSTPIP